jgi:hypothetical protein
VEEYLSGGNSVEARNNGGQSSLMSQSIGSSATIAAN